MPLILSTLYDYYMLLETVVKEYVKKFSIFGLLLFNVILVSITFLFL